MGFENIVQPFQSVDIGYPRRIARADAPPPADNVVLSVGGTAGVKTLGYSRSYSLTTYMEKKQKEVSKKEPKSAFTGHFGEGVIGQPFGGSG